MRKTKTSKKGTTGGNRRPPKDRSNGMYSKVGFMRLPKDVQLKLANHYMFCPSKEFDDGTFQFARSTFMRYCSELGIVKRAVWLSDCYRLK